MKTIKIMKLAGCMGLLILLASSESWAQEGKLRITGFSNVTFSNASGDPANEFQRMMHEHHGGDPEITEEGTDISFPGLNVFLNSQLNDKLIFQGELRFAVQEEGLEVGLEQTYLKYAFSDKFNITSGLFITPLGYLARNQRDLHYLNYSYRVRDMINAEFGYTPFRTLGLKIDGSLPTGNSALRYWLAFGGARSTTPSSFISEVQIGDEEHSSGSFTANLEFYKPTENGEINIGFGLTSTPKIISYYIEMMGEEAEIGHDVAIPAEEMELSEIIIAPYVRYDANKFQLFFEYHKNTLTDELGNTQNDEYSFVSFSGQILYKMKINEKNIFPYVRYDKLKFDKDGSGPYYGLIQEGHDHILRSHAADRKQLMFGAAFDLFPSNRIKIEYARFLNGPEPENGINIATAFSF